MWELRTDLLLAPVPSQFSPPSPPSCRRFAPQLDVLNYSAGKEVREEQREEITAFVSSQVESLS